MDHDDLPPGGVEFIVRAGADTLTIRTLEDAVRFVEAHPEFEGGNRSGVLRRMEWGTQELDSTEAWDPFRFWLEANDLLIAVRRGPGVKKSGG
jgi:hypothetical protein